MNEALVKIHEKRAREEPLYDLLQNKGAPRVANLAVEYVARRYGSRLTDNKMVSRVYNLLFETDDTEIQTFAVLFILVWEMEFRQVFCDETTSKVYDANYAQKILYRAAHYVNQTLSFAYHKFNIVTTVNNFLAAVRQDYMIGPTINTPS